MSVYPRQGQARFVELGGGVLSYVNLSNLSEDGWWGVRVGRQVQVTWTRGSGFYFHHGMGMECDRDWLQAWRGWIVA